MKGEKKMKAQNSMMILVALLMIASFFCPGGAHQIRHILDG